MYIYCKKNIAKETERERETEIETYMVGSPLSR
jgi:hypothetical protein